MGCALQMMTVDGEKYTRDPVEFNAPVRAAVQEKPYFPLSTQCDETSAVVKVDPPATALLQPVQECLGAEQRRAGGIHQRCLSEMNVLSKTALALVATHPVYIVWAPAGASGDA